MCSSFSGLPVLLQDFSFFKIKLKLDWAFFPGLVFCIVFAHVLASFSVWPHVACVCLTLAWSLMKVVNCYVPPCLAIFAHMLLARHVSSVAAGPFLKRFPSSLVGLDASAKDSCVALFWTWACMIVRALWLGLFFFLLVLSCHCKSHDFAWLVSFAWATVGHLVGMACAVAWYDVFCCNGMALATCLHEFACYQDGYSRKLDWEVPLQGCWCACCITQHARASICQPSGLCHPTWCVIPLACDIPLDMLTGLCVCCDVLAMHQRHLQGGQRSPRSTSH